MKNFIRISTFLAAAVCAFAACSKQDEVYKEFVVVGGYNYPAKPKELTAQVGHGRAILSWAAPNDPAVKSAKVYWNNRSNEMDIDYSKAVDGISSAEITGLEERSYVFEVVNFNAAGDKSLAAEIALTPYGDNWLSTHAEREVKVAKVVDGQAMFVMGRPRDEMYSTKFMYLNNAGEWVESAELLASRDTLYSPDALKGKTFKYMSSYRPEGGLDVVWSTNWIKSDNVLLYRFDTSGWTVSCTENQVRKADSNGTTFEPEKMFDGVAAFENSYYASIENNYVKVFPKIVSVDTGREGEPYTITEFVMVQDLEQSAYRYSKSVEYYVGSAPYDPNLGSGYSDVYGEAAAKAAYTKDYAAQSTVLSEPAPGRYFSVVFKNSIANNRINVWELEVWGYLPSQASPDAVAE